MITLTPTPPRARVTLRGTPGDCLSNGRFGYQLQQRTSECGISLDVWRARGAHQVRVGVGKEDAPDGKLPLCIALERKWPAEVVAALVKAYPEGATTIDSVKVRAQPPPAVPRQKNISARMCHTPTESRVRVFSCVWCL